MKFYNLKDDGWIRDNFEKLVEEHPGEYVAVASGQAVFGQTRQEAEGKLRRKAKHIIPSVMQIPHQESLTCAL